MVLAITGSLLLSKQQLNQTILNYSLNIVSKMIEYVVSEIVKMKHCFIYLKI